MQYLVLIAIVLALVWWLSGRRASSLNERLYLRRRGYMGDENVEPRRENAKDTYLFSVIESLSDLSPYARERAARELERMCEAGGRDRRMLSALLTALSDNDASVRRAAAGAIASLREAGGLEALKRRIEVEESAAVRVSLQKAIDELSSEPAAGEPD